jgi:hypothetical protein
MLNYGGLHLVPGMGSEYISQEQQIWWGREEQQLFIGGLMDNDTVDAGNSTTTILRPGLALGRRTSDSKLLQWNPLATDGTNWLVGFFNMQMNMSNLGATADRFIGNILISGNVYASRLLIPGEADYGISGKTYEFLLREQMFGRFLVDDDLNMRMTPKEYTIAADVTALTVTEAMNNTIFVTDVDLAASCTLTLPAPRPGLQYFFVHTSTTAAITLTLEGPATNEYWVAGAAANSIVLAGDNTTGMRRVRAVRTDDAATDLYKWVCDGVAA